MRELKQFPRNISSQQSYTHYILSDENDFDNDEGEHHFSTQEEFDRYKHYFEVKHKMHAGEVYNLPVGRKSFLECVCNEDNFKPKKSISIDKLECDLDDLEDMFEDLKSTIIDKNHQPVKLSKLQNTNPKEEHQPKEIEIDGIKYSWSPMEIKDYENSCMYCFIENLGKCPKNCNKKNGFYIKNEEQEV